MQLVIAEKPSVARDLARVLGVPARGKTYFESSDRVITWCIGHLVELVEPASYDAKWKSWRLDVLPMVPERFELQPNKGTPEQFRAVTALLRDKRFREVVNACDAGREGELIFRYVYDIARSRIPVRRLWISSLTDQAIRDGFAKLRPGAQFEPLADAARCRSEADWLVGMNATRAVTLRFRPREAERTVFSIGRVQTPTLAMLVEREKAIAAFVPADYHVVEGRFRTGQNAQFVARWTHGDRTRLATKALADQLVVRDAARGRSSDLHGPVVERVDAKSVRESPPLLFDLTSLQRTANQRFGYTASRTLEIAQSLYERHKVLTYPRTDSRHLTRDIQREVPAILGALAKIGPYAQHVAPLLPKPPDPGRRVFDDAKVSDHHAIIPTTTLGSTDRLDRDEQRIFDLVARRFMAAFHPDAVFDQTDVLVRVGPGDASVPPNAGETRDVPLTELPAPPDRYRVRGRVRRQAGWQDVAGIDAQRAQRGARPRDEDADGDEAESAVELPALRAGDRLDAAFEANHKQTRPPKRFTEAMLLGAMESAGKQIDDDAARLAMKDRGLGTPATRASILETLVKRGYLTRDAKHLRPTRLGIGLIDALPVPTLASPALTGEWEARLARMARGDESRAAFMRDIVQFVRESVDAVRNAATPVRETMQEPSHGAVVGRCPRCGSEVVSGPRGYVCASPGKPCGFVIPKNIAGRSIAEPLARVLLAKRCTQQLGGFRAKAGRAFRAAIAIDDAGEVRLAFGRDGELSEKRVAEKPAAKPRAKKVKTAAPVETEALPCPRCQRATLVTGKRGWGCARWREGCGFVVLFEQHGRTLSASQLRDLITRGKTRVGGWSSADGAPVKGRLRLDANAPGGAMPLEEA